VQLIADEERQLQVVVGQRRVGVDVADEARGQVVRTIMRGYAESVDHSGGHRATGRGQFHGVPSLLKGLRNSGVAARLGDADQQMPSPRWIKRRRTP
jgi:hypothetical protein